jgi:glucose-1-phosphate cytidylyltransferase
MNLYAQYNHREFILALGYKGEVIKKYFSKKFVDWDINSVDTGLNTMTGGRVKRLQKIIGNETCMLTYGDGLSNINLDLLINFHKSHGKLVTVSAVHPPARFGAIKLDGDKVMSFKEKSNLDQGWINGGFFVIEPGFFNLINDDQTYLEREPLEKAAKLGELFAYRHTDFWKCMDTKRDKDDLESIISKEIPWLKKQ